MAEVLPDKDEPPNDEALQKEQNGARLLSDLRARTGMSQTAVAAKAQISRSMLTQVEAAERKPSRKLLVRLAQALSLTPDEEHQLHLAFGFTPEADTTEQIAAFLRADKNLEPEQADMLADMVREAYQRAIVSSLQKDESTVEKSPSDA